MATIADELFNDLVDSGSENEEEDASKDIFDDFDGSAKALRNGQDGTVEDANMDDDEDEEVETNADTTAAYRLKVAEQEDEEDTKARVEKMELHNVSDVRSIAPLIKQLDPVIEKIEYYKALPPGQETKNIGSIEDNPEYKLLTQSNTLSTSIDGEIILVHKFIRDHYSVRFPELETLVQNPLDYARTVAIIGNGPMENIRAISETKDNIVGRSLKQVLDGPSLMVVTVEATTTTGVPLSEAELATVRRACEMTIKLDNAKKTLTDYVQSRMSMFAPNLTALIGSLTAAQLLNFAGGIKGLAKTPACNIPPLGSKKNARAIGMATNVGIRHQGFLYSNDIIREVPTDLKVQAMRILSAKIVLAARVDQAHDSPTGEQGLIFADQVEKRIHKLSESAPNKGVRALAAPDDKPARKRGGRQARKAKESTAVTELRRAQNRMVFGKEEAEVSFGDSTVGLGMIGAQNDGRIRAQQIDQRTRAKLSKKNPGWGAAPGSGGGGGGNGMSTNISGTSTSLRGAFGGSTGPSGFAGLKASGLRTSGVGPSGFRTALGGAGGGTVSTIAFTPVQGLELVDPKVRAEMSRKRKAEEQDRWFKGGTFTQVGNSGSATGAGNGAGTGTGTGTGKVDGGGFKVPALPSGGKRTKFD